MLSTYKNNLNNFISYKSVSTGEGHEQDIEDTVNYLSGLLSGGGFSVDIVRGYGNPIVLAEYMHDSSFPICIVYGHYDVQPSGDADKWITGKPFELVEVDDRLYARGAVDNKGQIMIHITTILELAKNNNLKYNIKFFIEGDEETGAADMDKFTTDYKQQLAADIALVSDGEIIGDNIPTMVKSFRGGANLAVSITTATNDAHAGLLGNILPNAAYQLISVLGKIYDKNNIITVPGFYEGVNIDANIRENNEKIPLDMLKIKEMYGAKGTVVPKGYDFATANGLLPTIQISGFESGFVSNYTYDSQKDLIMKTDGGFNNIIPGSAIAKMNLRFAPGQDPERLTKCFEKWFAAQMPSYVERKTVFDSPYPATVINTDNQLTLDTMQLLENIYHHKPVLRYCGASVPITGLLQDFLGQEVVVVDLGNEDCNMHGINENFKLNCVENGLQFSKRFFSKE